MVSYERHDWLAQRIETAIDPHRPIVDPHHHLWDRSGSRYLAAELVADARGSHNVTHTVFVECSAAYDEALSPELAPVGETRFVAGQAERAAELGVELAAIVSHVDLSLGTGIVPLLEAHEVAGQGRFRGVRHGTNWSASPDIKNGHHEPGPQLLLDPGFRQGVETLAARGHSFDAWLYFDQLDEFAQLARSVPNATMVLNHLGGPLGIGPYGSARDEMLAIWRTGMAQVARYPNVVLKVGGIGMEHYFGTPWADREAPPTSVEVADHWRDRVGFAIDTFGPNRCMFESNFPVDRQTMPYAVLWNAFQILAADYDESEQADLFAGTAMRTYGID